MSGDDQVTIEADLLKVNGAQVPIVTSCREEGGAYAITLADGKTMTDVSEQELFRWAPVLQMAARSGSSTRHPVT